MPKVTVSIVDDDDDLRMALVDLMRSLDLEVAGYASATDFLSSSDVEATRCIITDISMPGLTGVDLKNALESRAIRTPVIMITARAEGALYNRALASNPFSLLRKPFQTSDLVDCVRRAIASRL